MPRQRTRRFRVHHQASRFRSVEGAATPIAFCGGLKKPIRRNQIENCVQWVLTPLRQTEEQGMTEFSQVDEVLGSAIHHGDVPGVVAMAAARNEVVYQAAFGRRALADEAAMSTDTVFWIASMTKAI